MKQKVEYGGSWRVNIGRIWLEDNALSNVGCICSDTVYEFSIEGI